MASRVSPNLKVKVGADTSDFTKGMDATKKELRSFDQVSSNALSKLASAFGVNIGQVQKFQEAIAGAASKMSQLGGEGAKALSSVVASAGKAATAIGAIGVGAAVTAFKLLNEEAQAFKNTVEGANIELQTQAYLDTYRQFMHDYRAETGKTLAETESEFKKWWGRTWQNAKSFGVNAIIAPQFSGTNTLAATFAAAATETRKMADLADVAGATAENAAGVIYDLQRQQSDNARRWAQLERQIAEYRRIASDREEGALARANAINQAKELTNKLYAEQYNLALMIADMIELQSSQSGDSVAEADALNKAQADAEQIEQQRIDNLRTLERLQATITKQAQSEAVARRETADAIAKGVSRMQEYATAQIEMSVSDESVAALKGKLQEAVAVAPVQVPVGIDTKPAEQAVLDLNDVIQQTMVEGIEGIAEAIGTLLGNLMTGEGGVADFGRDVLEMVGTFAQKFGKVLVAFGVAAEAFRASLKPPFNGIAAIIAGGLLIAAGAAVKAVASSMSSSMGGASSAGSYVASSAMLGGMDYNNRTLQVEVTGTLTANGSQLVAVLNNENNRKYYTS